MMDTPPTSPSSYSSLNSLRNKDPIQRFRFFALPWELRHDILCYATTFQSTIDIGFRSPTLFALFLVSRQFHEEAAVAFANSNTFRVLPTHPQAAHRKAKSFLYRIAPRHRIHLTSLELRLGPYWTDPPVCWKIEDALGLHDALRVRKLLVFIENDPSEPMYKGFRKSKSFYTNFAGKLLRDILKQLSSLIKAEIEANRSVSSSGQLVKRLVRETKAAGKDVVFGNNLAWDRYIEGLRKLELDPGSHSHEAPVTSNTPLVYPHA